MSNLPKPGAWATEMTLAVFCGYAIHDLSSQAIAGGTLGAGVAAGMANLALALLGWAYLAHRTEAKSTAAAAAEPTIAGSTGGAGSGGARSGRASVLSALAIAGVLGLAGWGVGCALLDPLQAPAGQVPPPPVASTPVEIPLGGHEAPAGTVTYTPPSASAPRPATGADVIADSVATAAGAATGNPFLGMLIAQGGHALVELLVRMRKKKQG